MKFIDAKNGNQELSPENFKRRAQAIIAQARKQKYKDKRKVLAKKAYIQPGPTIQEQMVDDLERALRRQGLHAELHKVRNSAGLVHSFYQEPGQYARNIKRRKGQRG